MGSIFHIGGRVGIHNGGEGGIHIGGSGGIHIGGERDSILVAGWDPYWFLHENAIFTSNSSSNFLKSRSTWKI